RRIRILRSIMIRLCLKIVAPILLSLPVLLGSAQECMPPKLLSSTSQEANDFFGKTLFESDQISILNQKLEMTKSYQGQFDIALLSKAKDAIFLDEIEVHSCLYLKYDPTSHDYNPTYAPSAIYNFDDQEEDPKVVGKYTISMDEEMLKLFWRIETEPRLMLDKKMPKRFLLNISHELESLYKSQILRGKFFFVLHFSDQSTLVSEVFSKNVLTNSAPK
ncbi:MAG: hypothetical protein AAFO07_32810, partial [Bacteroidota bacterium]